MSADKETVRVVSTDEASQGPFVVMNKRDFDPEVHTLYEESAPAKRGRKSAQPEMKEPDHGNG